MKEAAGGTACRACCSVERGSLFHCGKYECRRVDKAPGIDLEEECTDGRGRALRVRESV